MHIKAHTPVLSYYTIKPDSSCHKDDTDKENSDKCAKVVGEQNEVPTSPTSYGWMVSVNGAAASCGLITELNICDFAHQIASGLQHLQSLNVSFKMCSCPLLGVGGGFCGLVWLMRFVSSFTLVWVASFTHAELCREKGGSNRGHFCN